MEQKYLKTHQPCEKCGSSDAKSYYADGGSKCFSCGHVVHPDGGESHSEAYHLPEGRTPSLVKFGLNEDTAKLYRIHFDGERIYFPYYDNHNKLIGAKTRVAKPWDAKLFRSEGKLSGLFGMQACKGNKRLIITEGEMDTLAAKQMYGAADVVSIATGADSAVKCVKEELQFIQRYEEVVIAFDMDEVGRRNADKVMTLLPPGKAKLAVLPHKDALDCLKADPSGEKFRNAIWAAKTYEPVEFLKGEDWINKCLELREKENNVGIDTGFSSLNEASGGLKAGEILSVVAGTGVGKTTFTLNITRNIALGGEAKTIFVPLEMSVLNIMNRLVELELGERIYTPAGSVYPAKWIDSARKVAANVIAYDNPGSLNLDSFLGGLEYAVRANDVACVVLDHKDALLASVGDLDYKTVDLLMGRLKEFAVKNSVAVILVTHQSRDSADKEDTKASLSRVRGSQGVAQNSDMVIGLERERDSHVTTVKTLKAHRLIGTYAEFQLEYDQNTKRMIEVSFDETESEQIQRQETDDRDDDIQFGTGGGGAPIVPDPGLRGGDPSVHEGLQPGLHAPEEERETNVHRSEGTLHGGGQNQDEGSEAVEPGHRHTLSVQESQYSDIQTVQDDIRGVGGKERIQVGDSTDSSGGVATGIVLDLETKGVDSNEIVCYGYANDHYGNVLPYSFDVLQSILNEYRPIFHNASFDVAVLRANGHTLPHGWDDTILMANILNSNQGVSLKELGVTYDCNVCKTEFNWKNWDGEYNDTLAKYCLQDCKATWDLFRKLVNQMSDADWRYYYGIDLPYQNVILEMEKEGLEIDIAKTHKLSGELSAKLTDIKAQIYEYYSKYPSEKVYKTEHSDLELLRTEPRDDGKEGVQYVYREWIPFLPTSNQHIAWALQQEGWKPEELTKTGQPKVDKFVLDKIHLPLADLFQEYSKVYKLKSSFVDTLAARAEREGRVRGRFNQTGTVTGRLSSSDPNLQNLDKSIRDMFIAPEGQKLVSGDLSNIEARILGYYLESKCGDSTIMNVYRNNVGKSEGEEGYIDLHTANAEAWGLTRPQAKTVLYLSMYGGGMHKLAKNMGITLDEAEKIMSNFNANCPALQQLKDKVYTYAKSKGYINTLFGRKIAYPDLRSKNLKVRGRAERQIFNALIQGSAADIMKDLTIKSVASVQAANAKWVAAVHDEAVLYCPTENVDTLCTQLTNIWTDGNYLGKFPIEAIFNHGDSWDETK